MYKIIKMTQSTIVRLRTFSNNFLNEEIVEKKLTMNLH